MRPTNEVFRAASAGAGAEAFRSRFASSGTFEKSQLESGAELQEADQNEEEPGT